MNVHVVERPGAAVGVADVERRGQAGDLQALGVAAGDGHVGLHHVDRTLDQHVAEAIGLALVLAGGDADRGALAQVGHLADVVVHDRLLEEADACFLHPLGQLQGVHGVEVAVGVDVDLDVVADRLAHRQYPPCVLGDHRVHRLVVTVQHGFGGHGHLQSGIALGDPVAGGLDQFVAAKEGKAEGGVYRHLAACTAEQAPQRQAQGLGLDVPESDVDGGDGVRGVAGLAARDHRPCQALPQTLGVQRIRLGSGGRRPR